DDAWLPSAVSGELPGHGARVLDIDSPRLVELLAETVPGLVAAPLCGREAARTSSAGQARPLGAAEVVVSLAGVERPAPWWRAVYAELFAAVERTEVDLDELGALPVPLVDGRTVPGARGVLLTDDVAGDIAALDVPGLHVVHPEAAHPLLQRLGATSAGPAELLRSPAVIDAVGRSLDDALAGLDVEPLIDAVLSWVTVGVPYGTSNWARWPCPPRRAGGARTNWYCRTPRSSRCSTRTPSATTLPSRSWPTRPCGDGAGKRSWP